MPQRNATLTTDRATRWLAESITGRLLHVFENTCSLINEEGDVITVANPSIGAGPFTILLDTDFDFQAHLKVIDSIGAGEKLIRVGSLQVNLDDAEVWDPVPPWRGIPVKGLAALTEIILSVLDGAEIKPGIDLEPPPDPSDTAASEVYARKLAGLGPGLTPSGDDVLMGLIHAYWVQYEPEAAGEFSRRLAQIAGPRTASLSNAMLQAAAAGEAGAPWHALVRAAVAGDPVLIRRAAKQIITIGHTSGADALAGFAAALSSSLNS